MTREDRALVDAELEYECGRCGASYYSETAAEGCCDWKRGACLIVN